MPYNLAECPCHHYHCVTTPLVQLVGHGVFSIGVNLLSPLVACFLVSMMREESMALSVVKYGDSLTGVQHTLIAVLRITMLTLVGMLMAVWLPKQYTHPTTAL